MCNSLRSNEKEQVENSHDPSNTLKGPGTEFYRHQAKM